jgi:hypothetical protein
MIYDSRQACQETGFLEGHAKKCLEVAENLQTIIIFREPGVFATGLIEEGYGMKGFRIDTKSCNWGPMCGFVCVDNRLTKDPAYHGRNAAWTQEAIRGQITECFFGQVKDATWAAGALPIVISQKRLNYLQDKGFIVCSPGEGGCYRGVSISGSTTLPWVLFPAQICEDHFSWLGLNLGEGAGGPHFVLCVDKRQDQAASPFVQERCGATPIEYLGHDAILGLTNPGTEDRGFKACVTADYDLFAIWPKKDKDPQAQRHLLNKDYDAKFKERFKKKFDNLEPEIQQVQDADYLPKIRSLSSVDIRLQDSEQWEHHRFGDVSARVMFVKTCLNTAIGHKGGNAIHHNDEAGNKALAKGSLRACFPLIAFVPQPKGGIGLVKTLEDFGELIDYAESNSYTVNIKNSWASELNLSRLPFFDQEDV